MLPPLLGLRRKEKVGKRKEWKKENQRTRYPFLWIENSSTNKTETAAGLSAR